MALHAAPRLGLNGKPWKRFGDSIKFIRSRPILAGTMSQDLFAVLLGGVIARG